MFLHQGIIFSYEGVRQWESKRAPLLSEALRNSLGTGGLRGRPRCCAADMRSLFRSQIVCHMTTVVGVRGIAAS
jgi:hypothetical protein